MRYARFLASAAGLTLALCAVGWVPTVRLAGAGAGGAMFAGCGIGMLAAAVAGGLLTTVRADTPEARMQRAMLAMFVRLAVVAGLGAAAVFSGLFGRAPLLFWIATAYVVLLPLEVRLAIS